MSKYNIYRITAGRLEALTDRILQAGYYNVGNRTLGQYEIKTYFAKSRTEIWWLMQFSEYFTTVDQQFTAAHAGLIIATDTNSNESFVVSLGGGHFGVQGFVDYGFGLNLAERIGRTMAAKAQSSKHIAGATSKSIVSFTGDSMLNFTAGEAADYVKLKPIDTAKWGKAYIIFATSVQLNSVSIEPEELNVLLDNIQEALAADPAFKLPQMIAVKDDALNETLDNEVAQAIMDFDDGSVYLGIADFELYGVEFVFAQQTQCRLEYNDTESDLVDELSPPFIRDFAVANNLDLSVLLRDVKAKMYIEGRPKFTTPLINLIDFVGNDKYFLHRGHWHIFNESFMQTLTELIQGIHIERSDMIFTKSELQIWQRQHQGESVTYRERYVIDKIIQEGSGLLDFDRKQDYKNLNGKKVSIEISDIYDPTTKEINVVKIGEAKDFGYAFDQAIRTLSVMHANRYITDSGESLQITDLKLTLITTNVNISDNAADISSLSFQIKLGELIRLANEKNVGVKLSFAKFDKEG